MRIERPPAADIWSTCRPAMPSSFLSRALRLCRRSAIVPPMEQNPNCDTRSTRMAAMEARMSSMENGALNGLAAVQTHLSAVEARTSVMECELGRTQGLIDGLRAAPAGATAD